MKNLLTIIFILAITITGYSQSKSSGINELSYLVGKWNAVTKNMTKSGEWKVTTTDTVDFKFIKKGNYIQADMGGQYGYELVFSFDQFQQKFRMSSIDQVSGLLDIYEGNFREGKLIIDNVVKDTYYTIGSEKYYTRLTLSKRAGDRMQIFIEGSSNGGQQWQAISMVDFVRL